MRARKTRNPPYVLHRAGKVSHPASILKIDACVTARLSWLTICSTNGQSLQLHQHLKLHPMTQRDLYLCHEIRPAGIKAVASALERPALVSYHGPRSHATQGRDLIISHDLELRVTIIMYKVLTFESYDS